MTERAKDLLAKDNRITMSHKVMNILLRIDQNGDGQLSAEELDYAMMSDGRENKALLSLLAELGVPFMDGESIVTMLDKSGDRLIGYEELQDGLVALNDAIVPKDHVLLAMRTWALDRRCGVVVMKCDRLE